MAYAGPLSIRCCEEGDRKEGQDQKPVSVQVEGGKQLVGGGNRVLPRLSCFWDCRKVRKWPNTTRAPYVGQCHLILLNINPRGLIPQGCHDGRDLSGHRSYGHIPLKAIKNSRRHRRTGELGGMSSLQNILANRL